MEVMDLSVRKPHPLPYPDPYMLPNIPLFNYPPPTLHPLPPTHLGLFQHLKYSPIPHTSPPSINLEPNPPPRPASSGSEGSAKSQPVQRPFKTLSKNNLTLVSALDPSFEAEYEEYRKKVLSRVTHDDYPATNRNMRRNVSVNPEKSKDPEYLERRRKNNEAAKKSREARRAKEDELAIRVAFLEKENLKMKFQLAAIEREKKMLLMRRGHL